jgi:hypothetical protein
MATTNVQTGRYWIDWSRGPVYGSSITLSAASSNALIAVAGLWVGNLVAGWVWSIVAVVAYRYRDWTNKRDGIHVQHQLVWRNAGFPLTAAVMNWKIYIQRSGRWKRLKLKFGFGRQSPSRSAAAKQSSLPSTPSTAPQFDRLGRRSMLPVWLPLLIWAGFIVAGVFVSRFASPTKDVLAKGSLSACGIWDFQSSKNDSLTADQVRGARAKKILEDTISGRAYARSCYVSSDESIQSSSCSRFAKQILPNHAARNYYNCPFRSSADEVWKGGACDTENLKSSLVMSTEKLDTSLDLGINAASHNAIGFQKVVNCSVLSLTNRTNTTSGLGIDTGLKADFTTYRFGSVVGSIGVAENITEWISGAASQSNRIGYIMR